MAPNIKPFSRFVEPEDEDCRIRCAILGCGMVRLLNSYHSVWDATIPIFLPTSPSFSFFVTFDTMWTIDGARTYILHHGV